MRAASAANKHLPPRLSFPHQIGVVTAGQEIAALVLGRYPGAASPWRVSVEDYRDALRTEGRALDPSAVDRAARVFPALAAEIAERGRAAHQERLLPALKADVSRWVLEGVTPPRRDEGPGSRSGAAVAQP